jgi:hypothetical protein
MPLPWSAKGTVWGAPSHLWLYAASDHRRTANMKKKIERGVSHHVVEEEENSGTEPLNVEMGRGNLRLEGKFSQTKPHFFLKLASRIWRANIQFLPSVAYCKRCRSLKGAESRRRASRLGSVDVLVRSKISQGFASCTTPSRIPATQGRGLRLLSVRCWLRQQRTRS